MEFTNPGQSFGVHWFIHAIALHKNSFIEVSTALCLAKEGTSGICEENETSSSYTQTQLGQHIKLLNDAKALIDAESNKSGCID